ncbi:four-carbon acid sugar kinase family protein [Kalamiella sp. sgz302252]|uniref:four-carbon acid sugar kinase family protein n=1 Tax=Pantoea sp. sgz302252 TaxID=3341827 RepID=UPI0036D31E46
MTRLRWKTPVLVIADDFTGANDAGVGLASVGARVHVLFDAAMPAEQSDVRVVNTDSRAVSAELAASRTAAAVSAQQEMTRDGWLFKKIDSTLRGNPGAEIEAALLASGKKIALITPAVPALGRTTLEGCCYIDGRLLTETEYASDPKTPVTSASVIARLSEQSTLSIGLIPLAKQENLPGQIEAAIAEGKRLIVLDAQTNEDLQRIMQAADELAERPLLAGAAGLSDALGRQLAGRAQQEYGSTTPNSVTPASVSRFSSILQQAKAGSAKPVLAVIGSMSEAAQRQIARLAQQQPIQLIDVDIGQLFNASSLAWRQAATEALQQGRHCVIRTCQQLEQRQEIAALCERYGLSRQQLGEQICTYLAELTADVLRDVTPSALYLSGGDVAIAVARGLGAQGFQIKGQVAGCVPYGYLLQGKDNLLVLTKAGGFGDENTLVEVFRFIEEKASE